MESHELTSAVYKIEETLKEILNVLQTSLNVLRDMQEGQQVECDNVVANKERELMITKALAEVNKPKKQSKQTDKENN